MTREEEFLAGLERAGLQPPAERFNLMVSAFEGYRELAALLHLPLDYSVAPADLYRPTLAPEGEA